MNLWPWVRGEWRRSRASLLGIALLIAVGGGITLAAFAGARRADTALDRRIEAEGWTVNATIGSLVTLDQMDGVVDELLPHVAEIPGVRGAAALTWAGVGLEIDGRPGFFFSGALGEAIGDGPSETIIAGRPADPTAAHQVTINEEAADRAGVGVGDTVTLRSYAADQVTEFSDGNGAPDHGPSVDAEVVGIFRTLEDITTQPEARVMLTAGFMERYGTEIVGCECTIVANVAIDEIEPVAAEIAAVVDDASMVVGTITDEQSTILDEAVGVEVGALLIAAVISAVASIVVMLQAVARQMAGRRTDATSLNAIGATRADRAVAWTTVLAPSAVAGTIGAVAIAFALSPIFPRGIARQAEVDTGRHFDPVALVGGAAALFAVIALGAMCFAWRSTGGTRGTAAAAAPVRATRWLGSSPAATLGTSLAFDPAGDGRRITAAGAIVAAAFTFGGMAGVAVIEQSVDDTLGNPQAVGQPWDLELQEAPPDADALIAATMAEPVDALAFDLRLGGTDFEVSGDGGDGLVQPMTFDDIVGNVAPFMLDGNLAVDDDDVVLGERLARRVGAEVGSEVTFAPGPVVFTVTGIGRLSDGDRADEFAFVTGDGLARLGQGQAPDLNSGVVRLGDEADRALSNRLVELGWKPALLPAKVATLRQIGTVPRSLAVGLAILGIGAVIHASLVAINRRRGDIAVTRALGFVPRQAQASIGWQATVTALAGALVGLPIGLVVGRVIWKRVVSGVGALDVVSVPWLALGSIGLGIVVLCAVCGLVVGGRAARLRPASVLRSE